MGFSIEKEGLIWYRLFTFGDVSEWGKSELLRFYPRAAGESGEHSGTAPKGDRFER